MTIVIIVLSVLLGLGFLGAGIAKLRSAEPVTGVLDRLGVSPALRTTIGALEVLGGIGVVVGLWLEPLGVLAAVGLVLMMLGAIIYHLKAGDAVKEYLGALVLLVLSGVVLALQAAAI